MSVTSRLRDSINCIWKDICKNARDTILFLDKNASECLHWNGSMKLLFDCGVKDVKEFTFCEYGSEDDSGGVFLTTSSIDKEDSHVLSTLSSIIRASHFQRVTLLSAQPCRNEAVVENVKKQLKQWMGDRMDQQVTISHFPFQFFSITDGFWLCPMFKELFPVLGLNVTPVNIQMQIEQFVGCLQQFLSCVNLSEEICSFGDMSYSMAECYLATQGSDKRTSGKRGSVLFVDRTLDLAGAMSAICDSFVDRIMRTLPAMEGATDVCVNMASLCSTDTQAETSLWGPVIRSGCIAHKDSSTLDQLVFGKPKEALMQLNRIVVQRATESHVNVDMAARVTPQHLTRRVASFKSHPESMVNHIGILEQALAVAQTVESPLYKKLEEMQNTQTLLVEQSLTAVSGAAQCLSDILENRKSLSMNLEDVCQLLLYLYSLGGVDLVGPAENVKKLINDFQETLMKADPDEIPEYLLTDEDNYKSVVGRFFDQLDRCGAIRNKYSRYNAGILLDKGDVALPCQYQSLLKRIVADIADDPLHLPADIRCHTAEADTSRRQPTVLIVVVIGGVTASEVKSIHEAAKGKSLEVMVLSNKFLLPQNVTKDVFRRLHEPDEANINES